MKLKYVTRVVVVVTVSLLLLSIKYAGAREVDNLQQKKHFLWSVESGDRTIYLIGSIHILKKDAYPLPADFEKAYKVSDKVVFETDLEGMSGQAIQARMMRLGMYPEGEGLPGNISRSTYELLMNKVTSAGLPMKQFDRFKPWFGALTLTSVELLRLGFSPDLGVDKYFFDKAKKDRKETVFLETNEYQINLFAGMSDRQQEALLGQMLKELDVIELMFSDMKNAWETGNTVKLASILSISFKEYPDMYDRLIVKRNRTWIPKIERLIKQGGGALIVVGAGHLVGKKSVVELLQKKGYKVTQR